MMAMHLDTNPENILAASAHRNPYPYYATLAAGPALVFDAPRKLWIASRLSWATRPAACAPSLSLCRQPSPARRPARSLATWCA
jgi:hypothetical protein